MTRRQVFSSWCLVVFALAALAGCKVDQEKEVATYREVLDADVAQRPNRLERGEPLTLERALLLANQDNERINIEGENYLQAIIEKKRVMSDFLPTVNLVPTYIVRDHADNIDERTLDVPIEGGYGNLNAIRSVEDFRRAAATIEQRLALLLDFKAALLLDTSRAYYQVLRAEQLVEVLQNSLAVQEERVRDVRAQLEAGTGRPLDMAQAEAQAASTRVLVVQAKGAARNARSVLAFVIGAPEVSGPLDDRFEVPDELPLLDTWMQAALQHRQDYVAARSAVLATRHGVDSAFAQYYPSVSINLDYFVYRETVPSASLYTAFFQANIPLFTAGRVHADVRTAWSVFRQAKLVESLTRRQVLQDVEIAYQDLVTSRQKIFELVVQVRAAQEAFDQAADLVRFGRATNLERLVAQDQLLNAQLNYTSELYIYKVAFLSLRRVQGELGVAVESGPQFPTIAPAAETQPAATQAQP